jgi:hypothetical protein
VLSPARTDLADGSWVKAGKPTNLAAIAALEAPAAEPSPGARSDVASPTPSAASTSQTAQRTEPTDSNDAQISAAITAHIDSVVSDARRNLYKF